MKKNKLLCMMVLKPNLCQSALFPSVDVTLQTMQA